MLLPFTFPSPKMTSLSPWEAVAPGWFEVVVTAVLLMLEAWTCDWRKDPGPPELRWIKAGRKKPAKELDATHV